MTHLTRRLRDDQEKEIETMTTHLFRIMGRHAPPSPQGERQMKAQMHDFMDGNGPVPAHIHTKGGGWVADTAHVDKSAHIGPDARVFGDARVSGDARVYGNALVYDSAWVSGNARVHDSARVYDNARVYGNARVHGDALVYGNAWVHGDARVYGDARVHGDALVYGNAWVGNAWVSGNACVSGDAWVDNAWVSGNALVSSDARVKRGVYTSTPTSITRSDGYMFTLQSDGSIVAGCCDFTPDEAKAHWGHAEHHKHRESMAIVTALNAIAAERQ